MFMNVNSFLTIRKKSSDHLSEMPEEGPVSPAAQIAAPVKGADGMNKVYPFSRPASRPIPEKPGTYPEVYCTILMLS